MALRKFLFMNQVEGFSEEHSAADTLTMQGAKIENLGAPTAATDAATKGYVDSVATGLDVKKSCRLGTAAALPAYTAAGAGVGKTLTGNANGALTVDGVVVALNDRVLVMSENAGGAHVDHGIYTQTQVGTGAVPFILTRATDSDEDAEVTAGMFTFVTEGTANADKGFVLTTNDAIVVDTTALDYSQFSSAVPYTFDQGLSETAGSIKVELDTAADAQGVGAGGGSSGLEFDANTAAGKLRVAVSATGGINRAADGLTIENDPLANTAGNNPTTSVAAAGLKVLRAPIVEENYTANEAFAVGDPVAWAAGVNDKLAKARADSDAKSRVIGVARTLSTALNDTAAICREGPCVGAIAGATAGDPFYLQDTGGVGSFAAITAGKRVIRVGYAKNATTLDVKISDLGKKAA